MCTTHTEWKTFCIGKCEGLNWHGSVFAEHIPSVLNVFPGIIHCAVKEHSLVVVVVHQFIGSH